jgi:hypothetical protein
MATTKVSGELVDLNEATSESGLKIPTGTNANRPATDVAGMVRNNTNESSDGSASCEEYYNGTAWQKINNVAIPPPLAFKTIIYNGNGTSQSITGLGFQPDLVWIKQRGGTNPNGLWDSTRGAGKLLVSDTSAAESGNAGDLMGSFDADGFQVNRNYLTNTAYDNTNYGIGSAAQYVAWCWKANGGTTSSNTDGSTTSTVQAYPEAGFSIVKYTGTGANASVGHGLGTDPKFIMIKKTSGASDWVGGALDWTKYLEPNGSPGFRTSNVWQDTAPTSSVFTLTTGGDSNGNGNEYIAYCFADADNVSKIGSYTGNGSTTGPIVTVGFQADWILIKRTDATEDWKIIDSVRGFANSLEMNESIAEETGNNSNFTITSTGFQIGDTNGDYNANGGNYLFMALKTN